LLDGANYPCLIDGRFSAITRNTMIFKIVRSKLVSHPSRGRRAGVGVPSMPIRKHLTDNTVFGPAALESYYVAVLNCRKLEAALRDAPSIDACFEKISRMLRSSVQQATMLARGLRLLPSTSVDKRQPPDSPHPLPDRRLHAVAH
jgi:hypothetical protein